MTIPRIMVDLETLGNRPESVIVAIGAVKFGDGRILEEFYERVDPISCVEVGLKIDAPTVLWWMKQPDEARLEMTKPATPLRQVLEWLAAFIGPRTEPETEIWGNGASFDNVVLGSAFAAVKMKQPWHFAMDRCYRTVRALNPQIPFVRIGTAHNALEDAKSQAMHLMAILACTPPAPVVSEAPEPSGTAISQCS